MVYEWLHARLKEGAEKIPIHFDPFAMPRPSPLVFLLLLFFSLTALSPAVFSPAGAHEIRPAIVTADFQSGGEYTIELSGNLEALLAGIGSQHDDTDDSPLAQTYNELRRLSSEALTARVEAFLPRFLDGVDIRFDDVRSQPRLDRVQAPTVGDPDLARTTTLILKGQTPPGAPLFTWRYNPAFGDSVLRVRRADDGKMAAFWLKNGERSPPVPVTGAPPPSTMNTALRYIGVGFAHILPLGLDHVLFVLGLFLLSTRLRPLIIQVTNFTIAHTITLGFSMAGVFSLPATLVEPLIALSIVFVALENWFTDRLTPWRPYIVFGFGLIHGLGFAGVLQELGLDPSDFVLSLVSFNIGVELGQLAVILAAYALVGFWFGRKSWYRPAVVRPASALIALVGLFWFVERLT